MPRIKVWDLPLRIFHWALAFCVIATYVAQSIGGNAMIWHSRFGLAIIGLVTFRLAWGFVGSTHARFRHFVRGPAAVAAYLRGQWSGLGHNPLGALSVVALLAVLLLLALTGLFANDDIAFEGPLYALVDKDLSDWITKIHHWFEPVILILVGLHVAAIAFYTWVKKQPLVRPMIDRLERRCGRRTGYWWWPRQISPLAGAGDHGRCRGQRAWLAIGIN